MQLQRRTKIILAIFSGCLLGIGLLFAVFALYGFSRYNSIFVSTQSGSANPQLTTHNSLPTPTPDPLAPFGVLLLGYGGNGHDGGYLTDTMILAYVQPREEKIALISVPRDLWIPVPITESTTKQFKINAAYAIGRDDKRYPDKPAQYRGEGGGGALAKTVFAEVTGLPVQYFTSLSFLGFTKSIDVLGGVTVNVPISFDDYLYPIEEKKNDTCGRSEADIQTMTATLSGQKLEEAFECRYEHLHFDAGNQLLDGTTALKYVRSRHSTTAGAGGDYARSTRQRNLLTAVKEKIFTVQFVPKLIPFVSNLTYDMQTDIDLNTLQKWVGQADAYRTYEIQSIELSEKNVLKSSVSSDRQYILIPKEGENNWQSIHEFIRNELTATSSATTQ